MFFEGRDELQAALHKRGRLQVSDEVEPASTSLLAAPVSYRPDIDGLRAVAVLSVVFFHAGLPLFSGGFVGVDVFFVISGYLITSIIRGQLVRGRFSIRDFYDRRIRRIFPALFTVVAASIIAGCWWMMPFDLQGFGANLAAMAGFASNFFFIKTGYFDGGADIMPLMHTWSLAVEEQFYIVFPLVFALLARRGAKSTRWGLSLLLAGSLAVNVYGALNGTKYAFYTPWHRAWELLAGSILALGWLPSIASRRLREALSLAGIAAIAIAVFSYDAETPFPGAAALLPVVGTVLLIHSGGGGPSWVAQGLSTRGAVFIGLLSYSLYLWHWPIFVFARYRLMRELSASEGLLFSGLALLLAYVSWRFVERPFRSAGQPRGRVFAFAFLSSIVTALLGAGLYFTRGAPGRFSGPVLGAAMAAFDENPDCDACHNHKPAQVDADDVCLIGSAAQPSFVLLGDSFADALVPGIAAAAHAAGRAGFVITKGGCAPLLQTGSAECQAFSAAALAFLTRHPGIDTVLMSARWSGFAEGSRFGENRAKVFLNDARTETPSVEDSRRVLVEGFERSLAAFAPRRVVVIGFSPEQTVRPPRAIALARRYGVPGVMGVERAVYDGRQQHAHAIIDPLARRPNVSVIDLGPALCDAERCPGERGGVVLYSDDNHLSRSGAIAINDTLARAFAD
jgi:peptidoglycan/LPS O-acetylase OafA/YrhL